MTTPSPVGTPVRMRLSLCFVLFGSIFINCHGYGNREDDVAIDISEMSSKSFPLSGISAESEIDSLSCGDTDDLEDGQIVMIQSPGYPGRYPNKRKCYWSLRIPAESAVSIICETMDLRKGDFLIIDGKK